MATKKAGNTKAKAKKATSGKGEAASFDLQGLSSEFVDVPSGYGISWKPTKPGETVEGRIMGFEFGVNIPGNKKPADICHIQNEAGESIGVFNCATLNNFFKTCTGAVGARARFTYNGLSKKKKKGQNPAKLINVALAK